MDATKQQELLILETCKAACEVLEATKETLEIVMKAGEAGEILEALETRETWLKWLTNKVTRWIELDKAAWLAAGVERSVRTEMEEFTDGKSNRSPVNKKLEKSIDFN